MTEVFDIRVAREQIAQLKFDRDNIRHELKLAEDILREFEGDTVDEQARDAVREVDRLRARVTELTASYLERDADVERLNWLIAEGEKHFGTLWKEATFADIDHVRHGRAAATTGDSHG